MNDHRHNHSNPKPKEHSIMKIMALDLSKFKTLCCIFDTKTRKHEFLTEATDRNYLATVFKNHKVDLLVMEACSPSGWINDLAVSLGRKTLVCSTNEDAWKWSNVKRKTDKDDALKLAGMAAMKELKAVHMPSEDHQEFRSSVKYRKTLEQRVNKIKCTIRAWFVNHGITIDTGERIKVEESKGSGKNQRGEESKGSATVLT
jgi:transposase